MFGYVLPSREKLKEGEWQTYRATYCGLCHTLKRRYGFFTQFLLNYDFTFLALLLRRDSSPPCTSCHRCLAAPVKGRTVCGGDEALDAAADISVLLVYWKLRDQLADERGVRRIPALLMMGLFHPAFRRARKQNPALYDEIGRRLGRLQKLEAERCPSIDKTADQFALIMTAMIPAGWDEPSRRSLGQLLYHLGRWIYLIDAWDDLEEDLKRGRYNPAAARYSLTLGNETAKEQARESLERTVIHSENLAISAFHLGDYGHSTPLVENVLCAGLQGVRRLVFSGQWKRYHRQKKQELKHL